MMERKRKRKFDVTVTQTFIAKFQSSQKIIMDENIMEIFVSQSFFSFTLDSRASNEKNMVFK